MEKFDFEKEFHNFVDKQYGDNYEKARKIGLLGFHICIVEKFLKKNIEALLGIKVAIVDVVDETPNLEKDRCTPWFLENIDEIYYNLEVILDSKIVNKYYGHKELRQGGDDDSVFRQTPGKCCSYVLYFALEREIFGEAYTCGFGFVLGCKI
jgi:hypothetical protein